MDRFFRTSVLCYKFSLGFKWEEKIVKVIEKMSMRSILIVFYHILLNSDTKHNSISFLYFTLSYQDCLGYLTKAIDWQSLNFTRNSNAMVWVLFPFKPTSSSQLPPFLSVTKPILCIFSFNYFFLHLIYPVSKSFHFSLQILLLICVPSFSLSVFHFGHVLHSHPSACYMPWSGLFH